MKVDANGDTVPYHSLGQLGRKADAIITSHTLEHIPELESVLGEMQQTLKPGGLLIAALPSYTCERWRAERHGNSVYGDHVWTFGLSETNDLPEGLTNYAHADELLGRYFNVTEAEYVGDDTIWLVCENR
jgi:2-polyprenyl-3-methyl-5-hydroxy-6-metoxy-1,4-benzoquinol methylase